MYFGDEELRTATKFDPELSKREFILPVLNLDDSKSKVVSLKRNRFQPSRFLKRTSRILPLMNKTHDVLEIGRAHV